MIMGGRVYINSNNQKPNHEVHNLKSAFNSEFIHLWCRIFSQREQSETHSKQRRGDDIPLDINVGGGWTPHATTKMHKWKMTSSPYFRMKHHNKNRNHQLAAVQHVESSAIYVWSSSWTPSRSVHTTQQKKPSRNTAWSKTLQKAYELRTKLHVITKSGGPVSVIRVLDVRPKHATCHMWLMIPQWYPLRPSWKNAI